MPNTLLHIFPVYIKEFCKIWASVLLLLVFEFMRRFKHAHLCLEFLLYPKSFGPVGPNNAMNRRAVSQVWEDSALS